MSFQSKFSSVIHQVTPWIATAASIAAPGAAPLISLAAKALSGGLQTSVAPDPQSISNAITTAMANPDQLATLKKIDNDFALQMRQLGIQEIADLIKLDDDDRAGARAMQIQTRSWVVPAVAVTFVVGFFLVVALKLFHVIVANDQVVNDLITTLRDGLMLILAYYFGSSAGSDRKTELLSQAPPIPK